MVKNYYIIIAGKQTGPFSAKQILAQAIPGEFQLWTENMTDWKSYANQQEFENELKLSVVGNVKPSSSYKTITDSNEIIHEENNLDMELASFGQRLSAGLIHGAIFWTIVFVFVGTEANPGLTVLTMFLVLCLNLISYRYKSGNIGHTFLGLKVIQGDTKEDFNNPVLGLVRELAKGFLSTFIIPLAVLFFTDKKQNLYDLIFDTLVVRNNSDAIDLVKKDEEIVKK